VLPSRIESFGLAYAEAMSMGLPCIGLRNRPPNVLSSAEDVIPEGKAGYCVDGVEELRERVDTLARSPALVRELGAFAYELATTEYTTERYVDCLASLDTTLCAH
jgi:glycosyltransferase involved in cell wall biosynthesis